ncbi:MAG: hypothetical protein KC505_00335 [Myxococcales bacterium]|nr:hypothetical protein [Myxococcales bacterium]USN51153.1 MAG: hypothetical protein H6731_01715 [Myxococcales bacterium]
MLKNINLFCFLFAYFACQTLAFSSDNIEKIVAIGHRILEREPSTNDHIPEFLPFMENNLAIFAKHIKENRLDETVLEILQAEFSQRVASMTVNYKWWFTAHYRMAIALTKPEDRQTFAGGKESLLLKALYEKKLYKTHEEFEAAINIVKDQFLAPLKNHPDFEKGIRVGMKVYIDAISKDEELNENQIKKHEETFRELIDCIILGKQGFNAYLISTYSKETILKSIPQLLWPTFNGNLSIGDINRTIGSSIHLVGLSAATIFADGFLMHPDHFFTHDLVHFHNFIVALNKSDSSMTALKDRLIEKKYLAVSGFKSRPDSISEKCFCEAEFIYFLIHHEMSIAETFCNPIEALEDQEVIINNLRLTSGDPQTPTFISFIEGLNNANYLLPIAPKKDKDSPYTGEDIKQWIHSYNKVIKLSEGTDRVSKLAKEDTIFEDKQL